MKLFQKSLLLLLLVAVSYCDYAVDPRDLEEEDHITKRDLPSDVYPELMIVVDTNLQKKIGGTDADVIAYVRQLFGNIQAVYDTIKTPKFHFRIADIYLCRDSDDCTYVSKNEVGSLLRVDNSEFMKDMAAWARSVKAQMVPYDLMVTITSLEMRKVVNDDGTSPRGTGLAGKAYLGGVCGDSNVAIVTDNGGFEGIKVISHEMAHLFGAVHDGAGGGGEACSANDGYIMGGSSIPENLFRPSPCAIRSMAKHLSSARRDCLRNDRAGKYSVDHTLPGVSKSTDEQCKQKYGPESKNCPFFGNIVSEICQKHWCFYPLTGTCRANGGAFSGTPCDQNNPEMHCYMSYGCVDKQFKAPQVDVDLSDFLLPPDATTTQPSMVTEPVTDANCKDAHRTHLRITSDGLMTNCTENYRLYPDVFCGTGWVRDSCCATARAKCRGRQNDVVG